MADGQYTEQIVLTAQDASASAVMQQALAIVKELDSTVKSVGKSGQEAGEKAAQGFGKVKSEAETATGGMKTFADHTRLATMGLDALGLEAAAAGARVGGLIDVLDEAKAALPELLALGVAIGTIGTGFMFLKDAIAEAGKFDQSMTELGQTVRDQGGDWKALSAEVLEWADVQERTTQFSRTEAVDALRKLTASGMSLADAQKSVRIAEDAAAATGKNLGEVVQGLMEAEHGRTQILSDLGIATRAQIKDGMTYNQVLPDIEKNMGGAAAAAVNTLPGALDQLHNAFETFEQDAGEKFQGVMIDIVHDLTDVVDAMDRDLMPELQKLADWATNELPAAEQEVRNLWQALTEGGDAVKAGIGWMLDHKDEVEAFFSVVIAVKGVGAVKQLTQSLVELRGALIATEGWSAATLLVESFTTKLAGGAGLSAALKAVTTGMGDLGISAAALRVALGGVLIGEVAALVKELMDLGRALHGDQTAFDLYGNVLSDVIRFEGQVVDTTAELMRHIAGWVPGVNAWADAWTRVGDAMQRAANANISANASKAAGPLANPAARSAMLAHLERQIADTSLPSGMRANLQAQLNSILSQYGMTPSAAAASHGHGKNPADTKTGVDGMIGGGSGGAGFTYTASQDLFANETRASVGSADAQVKALDPLVRLKNRLTTQEEELARAMKMSSTQAEYDAKARELQNKQIADALTYEKALNDAVVRETAEQQRDVTAVNSTKDAYEQARLRLDAFNKSLDGKTKLSEADKQKQKELEQAVKDATKAHENAKTALGHVNAALSQHITQLDQARQKYNQLKDAADSAIPDLQRKWDDFTHKEQQQETEDLATFGMTNAQKVGYYQQMMDSIQAIDAQSLTQKEQYYQKWTQAFVGMLKDQQNEHKKFVDQAERMTSTFLDDIIVQHKSFKDAFKSIWDDIVKIFIDDVAKMIAESVLFKSVFGNMAPGFGGSAGFNPLSLLGMASTGGSTSMFGANSAFSQVGTLETLTGAPGTVASSALHVNIAGASPSLMSMFVNSGGGLTMGGALMVGAGAFGVGSAIGNLESGGGPGNTHGIWGGLGSLAGVAGAGALFGSMGGIAGLIAAGPAGWAVLAGGAILGGLVGGAFGHKDNPALMPDKYNTQAWGQFLADFGADNAGKTDTYDQTHNQIANGQTFNIGSSVSTATAGKGIGQFLHDYITSHSQADLQKAFGSDAAQIISMFSGWDSRGMHDGKNGNMMIGNQTFNWQQIQSLGSEAFNDITSSGASGATGSAPVFTLTRLYPDYNLATVKDANGNTVIGGGGSTTQPVGTKSPVGDGGSGSGSSRVGRPEPGIHVDLRGAQIIGPGGLEEVAQQIATMLHRHSDGQLAGSYTTTINARNRGGDWGPQ